MKNFGLLTMVLGFLSTLSSTFINVVTNNINLTPAILFWGLLSIFEIYSGWVLLSSKAQSIFTFKKLTIVGFCALTFLWLILVSNDPDKNKIIDWALKTLYYSGIYFIGLIIYYREMKLRNS